jgi:hypothetical protein
MISAYRPKFASPLPWLDAVPFPLLEEFALGGLSVFPPAFSALCAVGEGVPWFLAIFSSSFFGWLGVLWAGFSLDLGVGVLLSWALGFAEGFALGFGVGFAVGLGVGFGVVLGVELGLGFGVAEGLGRWVGDGVGFGVCKFGDGVGVT